MCDDGFSAIITSKRFRVAVGIILALFCVLTVFALARTGVVALFATQLATWGGVQIYVDLVLMCLLFALWMRCDARRLKRLFWPWFLLTLAAGAIGPLLYLATRRDRSVGSRKSDT